jgi:hypothetical protein
LYEKLSFAALVATCAAEIYRLNNAIAKNPGGEEKKSVNE